MKKRALQALLQPGQVPLVAGSLTCGGVEGDVSRDGNGGQNRFGIPFWLVGEFTAHFRTYFSGWIGIFTGTIRLLTHGAKICTQNGTLASGNMDKPAAFLVA